MRMAFSEAHLADLANSRDPLGELRFLKANNSVFLSVEDDVVRRRATDPIKLFGELDLSLTGAIAPLISFFAGGGSDRSAHEAMVTHLEAILPNVDVKGLVAQIWDNEAVVTNRQIEQQIDKGSKNVANIEEFGLTSWAETLGLEKSEAQKIISDDQPKFSDIYAAMLTLGMIGVGSAKGIRARSDKKSFSVAKREHVDALHAAFSFHCQIMITADMPMLRRMNVLKEHWGIGTHLWAYDIKTQKVILDPH